MTPVALTIFTMKTTTLTPNIIAFRNKFYLPRAKSVKTTDKKRNVCLTIQAELMNLGYILSEDAFEALSKQPAKEIQTFAKEVVGYVVDFKGANKSYKPLFAGFPTSVSLMSDWEVFYDTILSYWSVGRYVPYQSEQDGFALEAVNYTEIKLGNKEDFYNIFTDIVSVSAGLHPFDAKVLDWFLQKIKPEVLNSCMPESVPFKETLCKLATAGLEVPVTTSTDVLRIAAYLSYGSTELPVSKKMKKEKRWNLTASQKDLVMTLLNKVAKPSEMAQGQKRGYWKTLARHIGTRRPKYEKFTTATSAIALVETNNKIRTWESKMEAAFKKSLTTGLSVLSQRPSMFARKLDYLLRTYTGKGELTKVLNSFQKCAVGVSNKVLFELWTHFDRRTEHVSRRVWTGDKRKPVTLPELTPMRKLIVDKVISTIWKVLSDKFSKLESLGKVWVDPELANIPLPTNMRTLDDSLEIVIRGQRNPLDKSKRYIMAFCCWDGTTDLDFTATAIKSDGSTKKIGFGGDGYGAGSNTFVHSGDNTGNHAHNSELITLDLHNNPYEYVIYQVNTYSRRGGALNPRVGFMERDDVFKARNWQPATQAHTVTPKTLEKTSNQVNLFILDCKTLEWILIDEDATRKRVSSPKEIFEYVKLLSEKPKYSVYHLLATHAEARGEEVLEREDADTVFEYDTFKTSYKETLKYML